MDSKRDQISKKILGYLRRNPDAGDTLEGIAGWWLEIERIESSVVEVADALDDLMQKGAITAYKIEGGSTLYKIK